VHDIFGVSIFLVIFSFVVFFAPEMGGYFLEYNNFIPADSLKTPPHIAPVWYFTPFYSILRATTSQFVYWLIAGVVAYIALIFLKSKLSGKAKAAAAVIGLAVVVGMIIFDAKFWGVVLMGASVLILAGLPWLDHSQVKSIRYRPTWHKYVYIVFAIAFLALGYLGIQPVTPGRTLVSQICTFIYLGFFLLMPWWSAMGTFKAVPKRVTFHPH
jgi:ubiquinol-cytochrome c reductase cytochrome b subunit